MKRNDWILAAALLLAAAVGFGVFALLNARGNSSPDEGWLVVVEVAGETVAELPLSVDTEYRISGVGGENLLIIREGRAWIEEADCENQVCVHTGAIDRSMSAASISCLPHRVIVYLAQAGS